MMNNLLEDLLDQLLEEAEDLKKDLKTEHSKGELMGYCKTISKTLNLMEAFGYSFKEDKWRFFDPFKLLK